MAVVVEGAILVNLVIMTVIAGAGALIASAKKYIETLFVLCKGHPRGLAGGIMVLAWYFCYKYAYLLWPAHLRSLYSIAVTAPLPGYVYMRPALAFGFITLIYGPFLILTPIRPIVIAKKTLTKMVMAPRKRHIPWARIAVFVILVLMQFYVIFCIVFFFPGLLNVSSDVESVQLLVGIVVGYFLLSAFYIIAFYAVIIGKELKIKNINLLDVIRKNIKIRRGPEKPPIEVLSHKHYPKLYVIFFLGATAAVFALIIQLFIIETSATMWAAISWGGQTVAILAFIINIVTILGLCVFILSKAFRPVDSITEIKLDDGTTLAVDRIKHLSISRSADRMRLLDYATPHDPHTQMIRESVSHLTRTASNKVGYHRTTKHEDWSGLVHQSNDTLCMFFVATGASYNQNVAFMMLHDVQAAVSERYYDLKGFDMYAPNEWSQPMEEAMSTFAARYSDDKELKNIKPLAEEWAREYHDARSHDTAVLEQMKEYARSAINDLDNGLKALSSPGGPRVQATPATLDESVVSPSAIQPLTEPQALIEPELHVDDEPEPTAEPSPDLELVKAKDDEDEGDEPDDDEPATVGGVWEGEVPHELLDGELPSEDRTTLTGQVAAAVDDALEALRLRLDKMEAFASGWTWPSKLSTDRVGEGLSVSPDGLSVTTSDSHSAAPKATDLVIDESSTPDNLAVVSDQGHMVEYVGPGDDNEDAIMVLSTQPVSSGMLYFEIRVDSLGRDGAIGMGLAAVGQPRLGMPGWYNHSYGYHGDDGSSFNHEDQGRGKAYGPTWSVSDVVGMGWNASTGEVFYTLNGRHLGIAFRNVTGSYYPTVGFHSPGARARINFGTEPFRYAPPSCVVAETPISTGVFVFEAESDSENDGVCDVRIGVTTSPTPSALDQSSNAHAYDSLTGDVIVGDRRLPYGPMLRLGDVVSCQLDFNKKCMSFAVNGNYLGVATAIPSNAQLFPALSLSSSSQRIRVHFSGSPTRYPAAFGQRRFAPFCKDDKWDRYMDCERDLRAALASIGGSSRQDSPIAVPATATLRTALDRLLPFITRQLKRTGPLAAWQQLSIDIVIRAALVQLRGLLAEHDLSSSVAKNMRDPCMDASDADSISAATLPYILASKLLASLRWVRYPNTREAALFMKRVDVDVKKLNDEFGGEAFLRAVTSYVSGVQMILENVADEKESKKKK